jgi:hypothetical protein
MALEKSTTWIFDLDQEVAQLRRSGLHGLWRLLRYGENNARYPYIKQTSTLQWELTDTTLTIHWKTAEDLNPLLDCQLGNFQEGVGIPPGWSTNPSASGFYASARAHQAIVGSHLFRGSARAARRSSSLTGKNTTETLARTEAWKEVHNGQEPLNKIDSHILRAATDDKPEVRATLKISPHVWERNILDREPVQLTTPDKKGRLTHGVGVTLHPCLGMRNLRATSLPVEDFFLAAFSCLSYVFTLAEEGFVGLSLDLSTFSDTDRCHKLWNRHPLYRVAGSPSTACWCIAAMLDLPDDRAYPVVHSKGTTSFRPQVMSVEHKNTKYLSIDTRFAYTLLGRGLDITDDARAEIPYELHRIPARTSGGEVRATLYDVLLGNLEAGRPWYANLGEMALLNRAVKNQPNRRGLTSWEAKNAEKTLGPLKENDMDTTLPFTMGNLFAQLISVYRTKTGKSYSESLDKARQVACDVHLNRAFTYGEILGALNLIIREARAYPGPLATPNSEEYAWMEAHRDDPQMIRSLLLLGCECFRPEKLEPTDARCHHCGLTIHNLITGTSECPRCHTTVKARKQESHDLIVVDDSGEDDVDDRDEF